MKRQHLLAILAPLLLFAVGCNNADSSLPEQKPMTQPQTIATRPLCVGRFLIDVPVDAKVTWTDTRTSLTGAIKKEGTLSEKLLASRMRDEQERIAQTTSANGTSLLKDSHEIKDQRGRIFVFRDAPSNDLYYDVKAFTLKDGLLFSFHDQAEDDKLPLAIRDVSKGVALLASRDTWAIRTEPGFCFDNGFLPGKDSSFEATGVAITTPQLPGVRIFLETRVHASSPVAQPNLLQRTDDALKLHEGPNKPSVLRKRQDRPVLFGNANEVLLKERLEKHYSLMGDVELFGMAGALDKPDTAFSLVVDPPKDVAAQPDEETVLRLWDAVVDSIRLRPGAL